MGRRSDLMIKFCGCPGRSSWSSLHNFNNSGVSMTCKDCCGESTSGKGGPSCSNKLNSMALELPRPIDLGVRWKNVNRRKRATRRARTKFFGEDRMRDDLRSFYAFGNAMNRERSQEDAPVSSESEQLGVSVLGRRFSNPMGNVPIKKRKFHMDCSPSRPPTPVLVDPYEKLLGRCSGGYEKCRKVNMLEDECKEEHTGLYDAADFSGISILAAAACDSEMGGEILNGACSKLAHALEEMKLENTMGSTESHPLEEKKLENTMGGTLSYCPLEERKLENTMSSPELSLLHGMKEDKLNVLEAAHCTHYGPFESSNSAPDMKPLIDTTLTSTILGESASVPKDNCSLYSALSRADKTEIASDAKSSSVAGLKDSSNPDKSVDCSQDAAAQRKHTNATRNSRLHWDLNVAMEAWDTDCGGGGDDDRSGPTVVLVGDSNDAAHNMNKPQVPYDHDSINAGDAPGLSVDQIHMVNMPKGVNTMDEGGSVDDTLSHPLQHQSLQNLKMLKPESLGKDTTAETLNFPDQQNAAFASAVELNLGSNPEPAVISEHFASTSNVEKNDGSHPKPVVCKGLSHMSSVSGHVGVNSIQTSELDSTGKPLASRLVSEESTNFPTVSAFHKRTIDVGWSDNKLEETSEQSISELKNQDLLDDSGTSKIHQLASKKGEHSTDVLYVTKSSADTENLTHPEDNMESSFCDMAHVHEEDGADAIMNSRDCLITCASSSSAETYYVSGVIQAPALSSECNKPIVTDTGSIVDSHAATHSYLNIYGNEIGNVASDICFEHCFETAGIGKVDAEEDDSRYEDGEVRESGDWTGDTYEGQCGNWHYQTSDYKNEVITRDMHLLPIDSVSNNLRIHVAGYNGTEIRKEHDTIPPTLSKRSWSTNCLNGGSGASGNAQDIYSRVTSETQMHDINPGHVTAGSAATVSHIEKCNDDLGDNLSSIRTKNTNWDMFPEDQTQSGRGLKDRAGSSNQHLSSSIDAAGGDDSMRKAGLSNRDVQRIERPQSFDIAHKNELSRSDDGYNSGTKAERAIDSHRSSGGYDTSCHVQAVGGDRDRWGENSKHLCSTRKSAACYNYGPAGPRNAAEAAVVKMESNGFVVARDGTLVRAVDSANAGQMAGRMRSTLSSSYRPCPLSGRGSPIDRDGTCRLSRGPAHAREASPERNLGVASNRSGRYDPGIERDHTSNGNLSSVRSSLPSRQRGIPTGRASLNLSHAHSRSRSGSRSQSPHDWASPRNRRKIMANGGSTLQRPSRSPNRMSNARIGRMTSPQRQALYDDRAMHYSPPRNHNHSHPSTWIDGKNSSMVDRSDHTKRDPRRSPLRITSRNDRFGVISQEHTRTGEFYRLPQGRLPYGYDRGNKHDGNGDGGREYTGRYQSHSVKPYDRDGALKKFINNTGDKFRTHISAPRSPELQRRASPRRFHRSFER